MFLMAGIFLGFYDSLQVIPLCVRNCTVIERIIRAETITLLLYSELESSAGRGFLPVEKQQNMDTCLLL